MKIVNSLFQNLQYLSPHTHTQGSKGKDNVMYILNSDSQNAQLNKPTNQNSLNTPKLLNQQIRNVILKLRGLV